MDVVLNEASRFKLNNQINAKYASVISLELRLGSPLSEDGTLGYKNIALLDEQELFPNEACEILENWGMHHYYIPSEFGGKQDSFEVLIGLIKTISRRDLTVAIGHGKTYLGAVTVWVGGTNEQKSFLASVIRDRDPVSLGLTEKDHGTDLVANEVSAIEEQDRYIITGEKWLINNATRGKAIALYARTSEGSGPRAHSVLLVHKDQLSPDSFYCLPKILTHGIRGADISGIGFKSAQVPKSQVVGKPGAGLEITLKGLQVTRTLCSGLSVGAMDTALRTTCRFATQRKLYGGYVSDIPHARHSLLGAFLDILTCDTLSIAASRCLHTAPEQMSLLSGIVKYFIPMQAEATINSLSVILGARYYIRDEHDSGIFQKMLRDNALVGLFDGSSVVNMQSVILQAGMVESERRKLSSEDEMAVLEKTFNANSDLPPFKGELLSLSNSGKNSLLTGLTQARKKLGELSDEPNIDHSIVYAVLMNIEFMLKEKESLEKILRMHRNQGVNVDFEAYEVAQQYCRLTAGASLIHTWVFNRHNLAPSFQDGGWLVLCLIKLLNHYEQPEKALQLRLEEAMSTVMLGLYQENRVFSLYPFELS